MPLPSSGNITLQQIQSEYSTSGLQASSTAAGLDPLPTAMRDFLGLTNYVLTQQDKSVTNQFYEGYVEGGYSQAFAQHTYTNLGVLEYVSGGNSAYFPWTVETDYWVNSTPDGGNRASIAGNYDFEWEFVSGDTINVDWQGLPHSYSRTISVSPAYGTRVNMGSNSPIITVTVDTYGNTLITAYIQYRSKFYAAGTNTLISSTLHTIDLRAQQSGEV